MPLLTTAAVGALLGIRPREVVRLIRTRGLPALSLGRKLGFRILPADLARWIEREKGGP